MNAQQLLDAWEHGAGQPPVRRALVLLAAACPEEPVETLASWSVGRRDARLFMLRAAVFGPQFSSTANCPVCAEQLEMNFQTGDLLAAPANGLPLENDSDGYFLEESGYQVRFRLPNSLDLLASAGDRNPENARQALIEQCVLEASFQGAPLPVSSLPACVIERIAEQMRSADPQAEIILNFNCPACGHTWSSPFDIVSYFWTEIEAWTERILREVHLLARVYGWSEAEILNMSAWRRRRYLEMIER